MKKRGRGAHKRSTAIPRLACILLAASSGICLETAEGQGDYGGRLGQVQAGKRSFVPHGPTTLMEAVDPAVRKWYVPQELYSQSGFWQWETTNYAREPYLGYVNNTLEGDFFYDLYGNLLTQGWLLYNTNQTNPVERGHVVFESRNLSDWFSNIAIASEEKGQYRYALTVGRDLRTTLTPLVFSKPRFNGVQLDLATDKYKGTIIYSQGGIGGQSDVRPRTDVTTIMGGRFVTQVGDFVEVGVHMANAHQSNSLNNRLMDNLLSGSLPESKNEMVSTIEIVLRDDSPEDLTSGAAYFPAGSDIIITYLDGTKDVGKDIRFEPVVQGGIPSKGFLTATGNDEIRLTYDFTDPSFVSRARADRSEIVKVEFRLTLANDYQILMTSDRQTSRRGEPVLLIVERAEGNVSDGSNLRVVQFDYGLPTATHLIGSSLKVNDVWGFDFYGEYDLGWSYRKYPNPLAESHEVSSGVRGKRTRPAYMLNLSKQAHPFFFFGEAYAIDPLYNTQTFVIDADGTMFYDEDRLKLELVDDNDDQDRLPDLFRLDTVAQGTADPFAAELGAVDFRVFPGWDRNNDFIPDFNQNDNRAQPNTIPDYEEPFLRFGTDRPEFLLGVDMNHNYWVDRFENDEEPDYPYRRDRRGFNLFGGVHLTPCLEVKVGALREESIASEQRNHSDYAVLECDRTSPRWGRLRLFQMLELVHDDIADPLLQWAPNNSLAGGRVVRLADPLLARDTSINRSFVGHHWQVGSWFVQSKLSYLRFAQRLDEQERLRYGLAESDFFFGLINKAAYRYRLGPLELVPRWKSEYINQSRSLFSDEERTTLTELFSGLVIVPLLYATTLQGGVEYLLSRDLDGRTADFTTVSYGLQLTSTSAYQGYEVWLVTRFVVERKDPRGEDPFTRVQSFISIYAGLERAQ
ncbi:MAG: hypothetical protein OXN90_17050 [Gemmatimonadota bacterium]|nr:hypothetical protein [Gemmatimonadota bacterium]